MEKRPSQVNNNLKKKKNQLNSGESPQKIGQGKK